ncbi:recombinase family protein [Wolbachia endosymbiont of Pentidionis agamae]|uniref:recombinase family protein n=1 Tax=Wolbachia endosymbiont of Pentidionis agamae TaxID=3110435 RepID=UPI002FD1FEA3
MINVSFYARVSSEKQAQENTIESQITELERRISSDKHELLDEYRFIDNGISGSILEREGLERLRDKVAEGKIDKIYIHSPDRLSRKSAYQMILLEEFKKAGVKVIFLSNNQTDDTPENTLLVQVQGIISEYERTKIIERNRRGKIHAAKAGSVNVMSRAPYGYRYIEKHMGEGHARFEINQEEAEAVKKMFSWIGEGRVTIREVVQRLNEISITTQTGKDYWWPSTVRKILKNPAYTGLAAYCKTKICPKLSTVFTRRKPKKNSSVCPNNEENWIYIPVPSVISEDLFNTVQEQLAENKQRVRAQQKSYKTYLLQGLVVCQRCQYTYFGSLGPSGKNGQYSYYRCSGTDISRFHGNRICYNKAIRTDVLDKAVWKEVENLLKEPDRVANEYQHRLLGDKDSLLCQTLEKKENKIKRSISKLIDSYAQEYITQEEFEPRVKAMRQHLKEIEEQKEKMLDQKKIHHELSIITNVLQNLSFTESKLNKIDYKTKQNIIRMLVKKIEINHDNLYIIFCIKELTNSDQNRHNRILQYCNSSTYHLPR